MRDYFLIVKDGQSVSTATIFSEDKPEAIHTIYEGKHTEHIAKDGTRYSNILDLPTGIITSLKDYKESLNILAIAGTIRGGVVDFVDENEMPIRTHGIQSNVDGLSEESYKVLDKLMPKKERFEKYQLPNFDGSLEPCRTLIDWVIKIPKSLKKAKRIRFLDQLIIGPLVKDYQGMADEPGVSAVYAGCHAGLKGMNKLEDLLNFSELAKRINQFALNKGIKILGGLIPERIYTPADFIEFKVDSNISSYTGLKSNTKILPFMHDTSAEELAIRKIAKQNFSPKQTFVSAIWGSWFMDRVVSGLNSNLSSFDSSLLGRGFMSQTDLYGNPVKTVLTASGEEFKLLRKELESKGLYFENTNERLYDCITKIIKDKKIFAIQGQGPRAQVASQFPKSKPRIIDLDRQMFTEPNVAYATAMLMAIAPKVEIKDLLNLNNETPYIISGGASGRNGPAELFSSAIPNPIFRIVDKKGHIVKDIGDISSWMIVKAHIDKTSPEQVDISNVELCLEEVKKPFNMGDLRSYIKQWCQFSKDE